MADDILDVWTQMRNQGARGAGRRANQSHNYVAQQRAADSASDIFSLPYDGSQWRPLGVIDTADSNFGKKYFNDHYSDPAGDDILR